MTTSISNIRLELLKIFVNIPDEQLVGLKDVLARFLLERARDKADAIWDENNYSDEKLLELLKK